MGKLPSLIAEGGRGDFEPSSPTAEKMTTDVLFSTRSVQAEEGENLPPPVVSRSQLARNWKVEADSSFPATDFLISFSPTSSHSSLIWSLSLLLLRE